MSLTVERGLCLAGLEPWFEDGFKDPAFALVCLVGGARAQELAARDENWRGASVAYDASSWASREHLTTLNQASRIPIELAEHVVSYAHANASVWASMQALHQDWRSGRVDGTASWNSLLREHGDRPST